MDPKVAETVAAQLYAAYNLGGAPETAGLNYAGLPCPAWSDLPANVRAKWIAVAVAARVKVDEIPK